MADIKTVTKISENTREVVFAFQYQFVNGGNENDVSKIDVSALSKSANGDTCTGLRIAECWWTIKRMTVKVLAKSDLLNITIMHLDENQSGYQDFSKFGGLPNTADYGENGTGDILFTTTGANAIGDAYQIVMRAIKQY